jgi:hypothetical protein
MGMLSRLFSKPVKIVDAFFGEMQWIEIANNPSKSYFECERYFKPSGEKIGVSVTGLLSGPTQRQKDFFTWVEANYPQLVVRLIPVLEAEFGAWMPSPVIANFVAEFKPIGLDIPACDELPIEWEIVFDTVHDVNHTVTVGVLDDEPQYVRRDG